MKRKLMLTVLAVASVVMLAMLLLTTAPRASASAPTGSTLAPPVNFTRDIRPLLADACFACHGPDDKQRMAGLRFDTREGAFAKAGVIVPGNAAASRLIQRLTAEDADLRMPPAHTGRALTAAQIDLLRRWIDEGAKWETHWAYLPPERPELPPVSRQSVDKSWARNAIDLFILSRLEREGLTPSPEADRATLLRRLTYDLTGLPPTPAEVEAFLADPAPDAYEKRVEQLFRSPHYGERQAMVWLDLARYADTHGYHIDSHREMWHWRDRLIQSFNDNQPFDQFTIEQLAGDLLPNATPAQQIASGFNRNHMINFEGGAIAEEYQVEYVVDRVETVTTAWMGMTMGCARCHNHKYDPITQKEFYQFFAFFNTVAEEGLDGRTGNAKPLLRLPTAAQQARLAELGAAIKSRETTLAEPSVEAAQTTWEKAAVENFPAAPTAAQKPVSEKTATPEPADLPIAIRKGLTAHYELDGSLADSSGLYRAGRTITGDPTFGAAQVGRGVSFDGETQVRFRNVGAFDTADAFSLAVWLRPGSNLPIAALQKIADPQTRRGYELLFDDFVLSGIQRWAAHLTVRLSSRFPENALQIRTRERLAMGEAHHLALTYDGTARADGLKLYVNGTAVATEIVRDALVGSMQTTAALEVGNKQNGTAYKGQMDDLRLYDRVLTTSEVEHLAIHHPVQAILSGVFGKRTRDEGARLRDYYLTYAAPQSLRQAHAELKELRRQRGEAERAVATAMVMAEMEKPRETFILGRGDYRNKTEKVNAAVPAVLPPLPQGAKADRLALAKWLVDGAHPLTARVAVNRYWEMFFGQGIVKTSEDFGAQGEPPTHPELLDWLATELQRGGWDVRALQRLIVTSATYRQSSKVSAALLEKDPENRLLARGARRRLSAEMIRDGALAASGLLNRDIGGASVFPYQPAGLWEEMAFGEGFSAQTYRQSAGKDLYRRSLYTFWKRTVPPAALATFDAPDREKCTARRALTNTPLQALALMNDPTYVEAARALAERALMEAGKDPDRRVDYLFRLLLARLPVAQERRVLKELLGKQLAHFRKERQAALALLGVGASKPKAALDVAELAAWTTVASALLNLDETITRQ